MSTVISLGHTVFGANADPCCLEDLVDPNIIIPGCHTPTREKPLKLSEGGVFISGENMNQFKLHDVRRALCIIPQEPVIFSGSTTAIRYM